MRGKSNVAELLRSMASTDMPVGCLLKETKQLSVRQAFEALADLIDAEVDCIVECQHGHTSYSPSAHHVMSTWAERRGMPMKKHESLSDWLSRWFVARPRFEDGEPVQWVDPGIDWDDGKSWAFNAIDQAGQAVALGQSNVAARSAMTEDGRVKRRIAKVLGADDLPVTADETVYPTYGMHSGEPCKVIAVLGQDTVIVSVPSGNHERFDGRYLAHTPPDTQERIYLDKGKSMCEYWNCIGELCANCPSKIEGKTPADHYGVIGCSTAQGMDIARRQAELDKRTGGE